MARAPRGSRGFRRVQLFHSGASLLVARRQIAIYVLLQRRQRVLRRTQRRAAQHSRRRTRIVLSTVVEVELGLRRRLNVLGDVFGHCTDGAQAAGTKNACLCEDAMRKRILTRPCTACSQVVGRSGWRQTVSSHLDVRIELEAAPEAVLDVAEALHRFCHLGLRLLSRTRQLHMCRIVSSASAWVRTATAGSPRSIPTLTNRRSQRRRKRLRILHMLRLSALSVQPWTFYVLV